jgi:hypothetical protein
MEEAFEEGQGPHRAVEPVMMMTMIVINMVILRNSEFGETSVLLIRFLIFLCR